jgi:hypothetical protein
MIAAQDCKTVIVVASQAITDNAAWVGTTGSTPVVVDTLGYHYAVVNWHVGATDIAQASLIVNTDDDSAGASPTALYTFGAVGKMALPTSTDDNGLWKLGIDLRRITTDGRYLTITAVNGATGAFATCWIDLWRGDTSPTSATQHGLVAQDFI